MERVWLHAKGKIWDLIIEKFKNEGYWGKVINRTEKPLIEELKKLKKDYTLPEKKITKSEYFYEKLLDKNFLILDMLYRKTDWGTNRYNSASFHELSDRIRIYYEFYTIYLIKENISLVIFYDAPHMGWDYILYEVAKFHGIKTLILAPSRFPNRFFHFFDHYDYGTFNTSKLLKELSFYQIEKKVEKEWFYMKKNNGKTTEFKWEKLLRLSLYHNRIRRFTEKFDYLRLAKELCIRARRPQAFFRFYTERYYKKKLKSVASSEYNLGTEYVYFPLHYQPELTSTVWAGIYVDQVLAIEKLSRMIPKSWHIYVKENPAQMGAYRNRAFFERLACIPNLTLLSIQANTFDLIKNAQFVATVAGTAGWEAITGGKNVLTFGWGVWYKNLPGVFEYHEGIQLDDIMNYTIDHDLLQRETAIIYNKCGTGILDERSIPEVKNFSNSNNTETLFKSLIKILY